MIRNLLQFLISRHFQAMVLFAIVFALVSMQEAVPVRAKACPFHVWTASPTGDLLGGSELGGFVNIYETESMQQLASLDRLKVSSFLKKKFSNNSQYFMTPAEVNSPDGLQSYPIYIWNIKAPKKPMIIPGDGGYQSHAFSPDSTRLVAADDYRKKSSEKTRHTLGIWSLESGERLCELAAGHQGPINHVDWSPDGARIATASMDGTIRLWDAQTGLEIKCLQTDSKEGGYILTAFASNGKTVIGWAINHKLISWDVETGLMKSRHDLTGDWMGFYRYGLEHDIVCSSYPVEWIKSIQMKNANWLPEWLMRWLEKRRYRTTVYRYEPDSGSLNKMMTLRAHTIPLLALRGNQELLAFEAPANPVDEEDGQLTWYSLDQSYAWVRPFSWAAGVSLGYWVVLSLLVWRRRGAKKVQAI